MSISVASVEQVTAAVRDLASGDVAGLSHQDLVAVSEALGTLERVVGALGAQCAGEVARRSAPGLPGGGLARVTGHGNPGKMFSKIRGTTTGQARRSVEAGDAFTPVAVPSAAGATSADGATSAAGTPSAPPVTRPKYPVVAAASTAGELSVDCAALIVKGLNEVADSLEPDAVAHLEAQWVEKSAGRSAHDVQKIVARAIARVNRVAHEERERHNYQERYLWWKQDHRGMVTIHGELDTVTAAPILNVLEQMTTQSVRAKARDDVPVKDTRTVGQMRADALHDLARHALGCTETRKVGVKTTLVVRMDLDDLKSGVGLGTIDGMDQPASIRDLRRIAGDAGVVPAVLGGDSAVLDLGRQQRLFSWSQRVALVERDGGCAMCHAPPEHCEAHHVIHWEDGGRSDLDNGVLLCTRCHHDIHAQGWRITATASSVTFHPPRSVDPQRVPRVGGSAALDVDLPPPPDESRDLEYEIWREGWQEDPAWLEVTEADIAMVRKWEAEARA